MRWRPLTRHELEALYEAAGSRRNRAIVELLANTGVRVSEAVGLDIDKVTSGWLWVTPETAKNRKARRIPLNEAAQHAVDVLRGTPGAVQNTVQNIPKICTDDCTQSVSPLIRGTSGRRLTRRAVQKMIGKLGDRIGRHLHPHLFRHWFLTQLLNAGVPIQVARDLAGHSSIAITNTYLHSSEDDMADAVSRLGAPSRRT